jgi:hypothetical protein
MSFENWETFASFAFIPIRKYYAQGGTSLATYCEKLTALVSEVYGEKRRCLLDTHSSPEEKVSYLETLIFKATTLYSNLFEDYEEEIRYLPENFIVTDAESNEVTSIRTLKKNIKNLVQNFQNDLRKIYRQPEHNNKAKKQRLRIASRESFELKKGKEVNLRAVYNHLTDENHSFIVDSTFEEFEKIFSGDPVIKKVDWNETNALHYFITSIHGIGTELANEGKWNRASRCFTVKGNNLTASKLKDAGDPVAVVTSLLDKAIQPFK